jgi:hypothetical protein
LKRSDSAPTRLDALPPENAKVKPARKPITRAASDAIAPEDFSDPDLKPRKVCGMRVPFQRDKTEKRNEDRIKAGAERKAMALEGISDATGFLPDISDPEFVDVIQAYHPGIADYSPERRKESVIAMLKNNPRFLAELAESRNRELGIPNGPTATRKMNPDEQVFLTRAFRYLHEEFKAEPFRIHGETAVIGNGKGEIVRAVYEPEGSVTAKVTPGDKYHLHTHPPFGEPFASSASAQDHRLAAHVYTLNDSKMSAFVSNGKDVLHIQPDSMELVKLTPDPKMEKKLGKFPVAFEVPKPQPRPRAFAYHEAPGALKPGRLKAKNPPEDNQPAATEITE